MEHIWERQEALVLHGMLLALLAFVQSPPDGRQLVRAMHDRYAGKWYHTLTFVQRNTATRPDGTKQHSVWREYAALPGKLRIEFEPADSGNGALYARDSEFVFQSDTVASAGAFVHPLMVLGFDVYFDPPGRTTARLERLRFDLDTVHEDTWEGRPVWVVGAKAGDLRTRQFWVDRERLLFVRLLEPGRRDTAKINDVRFNKYQPAGGAWLAPEVALLVDGEERWLEEYTEIRTGVPLTDALFDARRWKQTRSGERDGETLEGFVQPGDREGLALVVPIAVEAFGARTFVVALAGEPKRWRKFLGRYVEAAGRLSPDPPTGLRLDVRQVREVEPAGTAHKTLDRGLTLHADVSVAVIPSRFAWLDGHGKPTGVNPTVLYTVLNHRQSPILFVLQTNDLLCVAVKRADGGREWNQATKVLTPEARRFRVTRTGAYRDVMHLPQDAAPTPGRYVARAGICQVDGYDVTTEFEVR